ncbi:hypothetical protein [Roseivirga echinicomitans]|uniref:hypothetical protein n=1 Tax=Roseivirga echinicomitans TaxID=296218 RepID=UPI0012FE341B|nr:hypothetical protein [Roseivirga echinicomitans]
MKEKELKAICSFWIKTIAFGEDKPFILPLGGMEFTWKNYLKIPSGAMIARDHMLYNGVNINLDNLK